MHRSMKVSKYISMQVCQYAKRWFRVALPLFLIFTKKLKIKFQNREWNFLSRIWSFSLFPRPLIKNLFHEMFFILQMSSKLIFKTGNGIIQTGNQLMLVDLRIIVIFRSASSYRNNTSLSLCLLGLCDQKVWNSANLLYLASTYYTCSLLLVTR